MKVTELSIGFPRKLESIHNLFDKKVVIDSDKAFLVFLRLINFDCKKLFSKRGQAGSWEVFYPWHERKILARELLDAYITKRKENDSGSDQHEQRQAGP